MLRFNARGPVGLLDAKAPGSRSRLNDAQRQALVDIVEQGPIPAIYGVVRWRLIDLVQWPHNEFSVSLDETTVSHELKKMGYMKLTAWPRHHAQNEHAMEALKKGGLCCRAGKGQSLFPKAHAYIDLVSGPSSRRPEEQNHAALGEVREPTLGAEGSTDKIGLYLRRDLSETWQGR